MKRQWVDHGQIDQSEFTDAFAAVSLLPGPASTQLAMWLGWRLRGFVGIVVATLCFVTPAVVLVLLLSALFLGSHHSNVVTAIGLGAGAVVPGIALLASITLLRDYRRRVNPAPPLLLATYVVIGALTTWRAPSYVPVAMIACGLLEVLRHQTTASSKLGILGLGATKSSLVTMALKVGALSFGGGFVIVPLMRATAVTDQHWLTSAGFVTAVAIGQATPGPVVATVAAVGYAADGITGGVLASLVAFAPSFLFISMGARHVERLRTIAWAQSFLAGAGPAAIGAIGASAFLLASSATSFWEWTTIVVSALLLLVFRPHPALLLLLGAGTGLVVQVTAHVVH